MEGLITVKGRPLYYLVIEEKFYLTPEVRMETKFFESKDALKKFRADFNITKTELQKIIETGVASMKNGQLCPGKRMRI